MSRAGQFQAKFTEEWCKENEKLLFEMIANRQTVVKVASMFGMSKETFYELCKKYDFWKEAYQNGVAESKQKGFNIKHVGAVGMKKKLEKKSKEIKEPTGSLYKPYLGHNRASNLFNQFVEKAENGCLGSASLVFEYLFAKQKPSRSYEVPVNNMTDNKIKAEYILNAMFYGDIDVDSANKMLEAIEKKEVITDPFEEINESFYDVEQIPLDAYNEEEIF